MTKFLKLLSRNESLLIAIASLILCFFWARKNKWDDLEPILGMVVASITISINILLKFYKVYDNTKKVITEHYCKTPIFEPVITERNRILIASFINDKTEQVALELTARYTQIKFTELPSLHIRYCQNYEVYASNAIKIKDDNFCDLLFFGDLKEANLGKNYVRLNFVVQKRIINYQIERNGVSEEYFEFSPNAITKGIITAKYDFFIFFIAGVAEFYKNNYVKSEELFLKSLKYNSSHEALSFLGDCYFYQNKLDEALIVLENSLKLCPDYPASLVTKAEILYRKNPLDIDNSINILKSVISKHPKEFNAYNNLGCLYLKKKQFDNSLECYSKSILITPNLNSYSNRGTLYKTAFRQTPNAIELSTNDFIKCLELTENKYLYAHHQLARNYALVDYEKALGHSNYYIKNAEFGDAEIYTIKANALCRLKRNYDEAESAAFLSYDIAKNKKESDKLIYQLSFITLVNTLTVHSDYLIKLQKEQPAFTKISIAFEMIKDLPLEDKITHRETIILYSIFMYNKGNKHFAIELLATIENHMPNDLIYQKLMKFKTIFIKTINTPNLYINVTD